MGGSQLKIAGMFLEFGPIRSAGPQESIFDNVTSEELPDLAQVVGYLNSGHVLIDMMDIANDPFDPSQQVMNGSTVLTDGNWLWRKDFAYYVQRHCVAVPEDFLAHIRERNYVVPDCDVSVLSACSQEARRLMFWNS